MSAPRRLLARLRDLMARGQATPLQAMPEVVRMVAAELVTEVCSVYVMRPGEILELMATEGLRTEAVGRTRLRVGEGIVGTIAAQGRALNLPDAQNHPAFAYRSETGEEPFASLLGVPVMLTGRCVGVLTVQNRAPRLYDEDEVEVLETVAMLLAQLLPQAAGAGMSEGFGAAQPRRFEGQMLVPGLTMGVVAIHGQRAAPVHLLSEDPEAELARLEDAIGHMQRALDELISARLPGVGESQEVLEAYRLLATDRGWLARVRDDVRAGFTAEASVERVMNELRVRMRQISDPYLRERLADLEDIAGRLLSALTGDEVAALPADTVLLARRLGPADLLAYHARGILGLVLEEGSATAHAAIVARALGIPVLGGVRGVLEAASSGDTIVVNADDGWMVLRPKADVRAVYQAALDARSALEEKWACMRDQPAVTRDGTRVTLMMNAGLPLDMPHLENTGADGIGLFRTEIVALAQGFVPDVAAQTDLYRRVLDLAGGRPVLFRTFDLGGDKMLPGLTPEGEENPGLGWRALRIGLDRPALLRRQLRALIAAAAGQRLSVMFPMVTTVAELRAARALLDVELRNAPQTPKRVYVGAMLEVPALLWQMKPLMAHVDFLSVGSNDLSQFVFAADRGAPGVAGRYDFLSAPMLDLLSEVVRVTAAAGVPLSVCGESAGRPLEALAMLGIGITRLSMPSTALLPLKTILREVDLPALRAALGGIRRAAEDGSSLREALAAWAGDHGIPL